MPQSLIQGQIDKKSQLFRDIHFFLGFFIQLLSSVSLLHYNSDIMATLTQEKKPLIPKLAQDLIAGTIGGWSQVVVGNCVN